MWWWILIWVLLVLGALATYVLLGWRFVRQVVALGRELAHSAERASAVTAESGAPRAAEPPSSVFLEPGAAGAGPARDPGPGRRRA